jgi:hypothetical protein
MYFLSKISLRKGRLDIQWEDSKQKYFLLPFPSSLSSGFEVLKSVITEIKINKPTEYTLIKLLSYLFCNLNMPLIEKFEVLTAVVMKNTIFFTILR